MIGEAQFVLFCKKCFAFLLREHNFSELDLLACTPKLAGKILAGENFRVCSLHAEKTFLPLGFVLQMQGTGVQASFHFAVLAFLFVAVAPPLNTSAAPGRHYALLC